jgi:hypothetical protein
MRIASTAAAAATATLIAFGVPAGAKLGMSLTLGDSTPVVGQSITAVLRTDRDAIPVNGTPRLVAVAPGRPLYEVIGTVTGASSKPRAQVPRDGFGVELARVGPRRWRAFVHFPRPGRWLLVIPNWGPGYSIPPPIVHPVQVASG